MEDWINGMSSNTLEHDWKEIYQKLQEFIIDRDYPEADQQGWISIPFAQEKNMICRIGSDRHTYFYLFDIGENITLDSLNNKYLDFSDDQLLRQARKGYPDWIMCGVFEDWEKLEKDEEANLALSEEEIDILNTTPYPYFINGLAGSGKSTILYYLFAHAYACQENRKMDFLFLSYSKKLVQKAKNIVKSLLRTNPSYQGFTLTPDEEMRLEQSFMPFQDFLKSKFVETEDEIERFSNNRHMTYERFQQEYRNCRLPGANNYKATIVWSVIRTFIKGRSIDSSFTLEDYRRIPRNDRTVNDDAYGAIYTIWENWYEGLMREYWDDLDLVRFVLKKLDITSRYDKYDIIYCDEAQDFTIIENQLIIRLSKYIDYDLSDYQKIPIAYAGDPNQTVSPTGFSWNRLKDIFSKSFKEQVGDFISLEAKPLNNNYRSKRTIVEFANSLQYIRKCFLSDDVLLQPQEQWNPQANPLPGFFCIDEDENKELFKEGLKNTVCIITGADGEYEKKLDSNELTEESTPINDELLNDIDNLTKLYTAISSKGLEFKAVVLYKFADNLPNSFSTIIKNNPLNDDAERYELAHYFTKLYIAVSRAKEILYIMDTKNNYERFWKYFIDNSYVNNLISQRQDSTTWRNKVGGIEIGNGDEYLHRLQANFNPLKLANDCKESALVSKDSKEMHRAAGYFEEAGRRRDAEECKAYVLKFEDKFEDAGSKFIALHKNKEADECFWEGRCWESLCKSSDATYQNVAKYMLGRINLIEFMRVPQIKEKFYTLDENWKFVAIKIKQDSLNVNEEYVYPVCEFIETLISRGFISLKGSRAELLYINRKYAEAAQLWEELGDTNHKKYFHSKEETSDTTAEKIYWMDKAGKQKEIFKKYSTPKDIEIYDLDERAKGIIFSILLSDDKTYVQALEYPYEREDKLTRLYYKNKALFLKNYVLQNVTEEKLLDWVERKVESGEYDLYQNRLEQDIFDAIFNLKDFVDNNPIWFKFMLLKTDAGIRLLKNDVNKNTILESINDNITKNNRDTYLGACFLDLLFDSTYEYARAKKYQKTIEKIFAEKTTYQRVTFKPDGNNRFLNACLYTKEDSDILKNNLRDFVERSVKSIIGNSRIGEQEITSLKALCLIYEKVIPYNYNEQQRKNDYDYSIAKTFYEKIESKVSSQSVKNFIKIKEFTCNVLIQGFFNIDTNNELESNGISPIDLFDTLDKEDAILLISYILENKNQEELIKLVFPIAKSLYLLDIDLKDFDNSKRRDIKAKMTSLCNIAIKDSLKRENIQELKLYMFIIEHLESDNKIKAKLYDELIPKIKDERSLPYFKNRALHYYYYDKEDVFKAKQKEYGIHREEFYYKDYKRPDIDINSNKVNETPIVEKEIRTISGDCKLQDFDILIKHKRKTIWISKNDNDIVTIEKGKITIEDETVIKSGNLITINQNFTVLVNSEVEVQFIVDGEKYQIRF